MTAAPADDRGFVLALAHGTAVALAVVEPDDGVLAELHPADRAHALGLAPLRRREWVAGRRALRRALGQAAAGHPLGVDDRGAPIVPAGAVGSVSHKRDLAIALAAADAGWTIGIDLERIAPRRIDIAKKVLTPAELAVQATAGAARDRAVLLAFALKEAVYKAIDPHLRRFVGFLEVAVWPDDAGGARVEPLADWGLAIEAAWHQAGELLVATARARRRLSASFP